MRTADTEAGLASVRGGASFSRRLWAIVLPIATQSLISALVNSADVIMISGVSQSALSAVSLAGQVSFVLMLFYFGISSGAGILTSQYWGKDELPAIERILGIGCGFSIAISMLFFLAASLLPDSLMRILTDNEELVSLGARYLRVLSVSYLFMSLSQIYLGVTKSMGQAKVSATISSVSLVFDTAITAVVVFVLFPKDSVMAVTGVAFSTMLSRAVELALCVVHEKTRAKIRLRLAHMLHFDRSLLRDFVRYTAPVQSNYLVWGGALTATAAIMGHVSAAMVAANSLASVIRNLVMVLCSGISQGGGILIGKELGEGRLEDARLDGGKVVRWALALGALAGGVILLAKPLLLQVGGLTGEAKEILDGMLYVCAYYCVGKALNSTVIAGIFCAGGDSRFGFLCDTIAMWGVIIPAGLIGAFVLKLPPVALYAVLCMDESIKLPFMAIHYRKYKWLRNITRGDAAKEASA